MVSGVQRGLPHRDGGAGVEAREACRMEDIPEWAAHHPTYKRAVRLTGNAVALTVTPELGQNIDDALRRKRAV